MARRGKKVHSSLLIAGRTRQTEGAVFRKVRIPAGLINLRICVNMSTKQSARRHKMDKLNDALLTFASGFNCSQSVLTAFSSELGLDTESALRIACGFGGGMGRTAQTCGAVTGAFMVIGLKHGQTLKDDKAAKEKTYALVREFIDLFTKKHGSTLCRELLSCNVNTPEGYQKATEENLFKTVCPGFVESAVNILNRII